MGGHPKCDLLEANGGEGDIIICGGPKGFREEVAQIISEELPSRCKANLPDMILEVRPIPFRTIDIREDRTVQEDAPSIGLRDRGVILHEPREFHKRCGSIRGKQLNQIHVEVFLSRHRGSIITYSENEACEGMPCPIPIQSSIKGQQLPLARSIKGYPSSRDCHPSAVKGMEFYG